MSLSAAIREAYASAPPGVIIHDTLELYHPDWAAPVRLVLGYDTLVATLESTAPIDAGVAVTFSPYQFSFQLPEQGQGRQELSIGIDNVARLLMPLLAISDLYSSTPVRAIYRPYISTDLSAPAMDPPLTLELAQIDADIQRVSASCTYADWLNEPCPGVLYTVEDFPGVAPRG